MLPLPGLQPTRATRSCAAAEGGVTSLPNMDDDSLFSRLHTDEGAYLYKRPLAETDSLEWLMAKMYFKSSDLQVGGKHKADTHAKPARCMHKTNQILDWQSTL